MQYAQVLVLHQAEALTALHVQAPAARVGADQQVTIISTRNARGDLKKGHCVPFCLKQNRIIATNGDNTYSQHSGSEFPTELLTDM